MKKIAIIVAGGTGIRMRSEIPKQFILLDNLPILMRTIQVFHSYDSGMEIRVVLPGEESGTWDELCKEYNFTRKHTIISGGETRFQSVLNGLANITNPALIAIHDGVRPLVSKRTIEDCFRIAEENGTAVPVLPLKESVREVQGEDSVSRNRGIYRLVQTPQIFQSEILLDAYDTEYQESFTDDASVVEHAGYKIYLSNGNEENIKITSPMDLRIAEILLETGSLD
jgi:2-C-methyl-D-erythritol 4-phosphate cytidylyltransferase